MRFFLTLVFLLSIIHYPLSISVAFAADSSPSADPLRQSDSEASVKSKLEILKQEIASKAAKLKQEVNKKLSNKVYVGTVKSKSDSTITLSTISGTKMVSMTQDTDYEDQNPKSKTPTIKTIKKERSIAALGDIDETGVLHAKKIVLLTTAPPTKKIIWGQLTALSNEQATIKDRDSKNWSVTLSKIDTKFTVSDFVIVTALPGKDDQLEVKFLHVIPQGMVLKPKIKVATDSATTSGKKK